MIEKIRKRLFDTDMPVQNVIFHLLIAGTIIGGIVMELLTILLRSDINKGGRDPALFLSCAPFVVQPEGPSESSDNDHCGMCIGSIFCIPAALFVKRRCERRYGDLDGARDGSGIYAFGTSLSVDSCADHVCRIRSRILGGGSVSGDYYPLQIRDAGLYRYFCKSANGCGDHRSACQNADALLYE